MNRILIKTSILVALSILLVNCASSPKINPKVVALKNSLETLQNNRELASRGGESLKKAIKAYEYVSVNYKNLEKDSLDYSLYAADRLIQVAEFSARAKLAEDKRNDLLDVQQSLVLEARTLEVSRAQQLVKVAENSAAEAKLMREQALVEAKAAQELRDSALMAKQQAELEQNKALEAKKEAQVEAMLAQDEANSARLSAKEEKDKANQATLLALEEKEKAKQATLLAQAETAKAEKALAEAAAIKAEMESLKNQLSDLQAKQTERGLLITLGDVLFEFNKSNLKEGATRNLQSLVKALSERQEQQVIVEGHTDSIGSKSYNDELSLKRADTVKNYLVSKGIEESRISTKGLGPDNPVDTNKTDEGRQKNRRVEIILPNLK